MFNSRGIQHYKADAFKSGKNLTGKIYWYQQRGLYALYRTEASLEESSKTLLEENLPNPLGLEGTRAPIMNAHSFIKHA